MDTKPIFYPVFYFALIALLFTLTSCNGKSDEPSQPKTGAGSFLMKVKYKTGLGALVGCTATIEYLATLVTQTSSEGQAGPFTKSKSYSSQTNSQGECFFDYTLTNVRPGRWRVSAGNSAGWTSNCEVTLSPGTTQYVYFTINTAGCNTRSYP